MFSLYSEVIACIVAAALMGLLIGWFIHRASAKRRLKGAIAAWEGKYAALKDSTSEDIEHLETRLQAVGEEVQESTRKNRSLSESISRHESTIHKARADAIELNRQQTETQERLQRIIQQKDREITELQSSSRNERHAREAVARSGASAAVISRASLLGSTSLSASTEDADSRIHALDEKSSTFAREREALLKADRADNMSGIPDDHRASEQLDATVRLGGNVSDTDQDSVLDQTVDTSDGYIMDTGDTSLDDAESTIALDDEALDLVHRSNTDRRN